MTNLGFISGSQGSSEAFGINNQGQVVGRSTSEAAGTFRAFVWLPEPDLGFATDGMHDLGILGGLLPSSVAYDINEAGQIVGQSTTSTPDALRAFLWLPTAIPGLSAGLNDLGALGATTTNCSEARGINDENPFKVTGFSDSDETCAPQDFTDKTFIWRSDTQVLIDLGFSNAHSQGFAVNTPTTGPRLIAGALNTCGGTVPDCGVSGQEGEAYVWQNESASELSQPVSFGDFDGDGRDVNDNGQLAGWGRDESDGCADRALFWPNHASIATNLHTEITNPLPPTDESQALGINNRLLVQVVGANTQANRGLLWQWDGSDWCAFDLNDTYDSQVCSFDVLKAHAINDNGWIVGEGSDSVLDLAFLLVPLGDCPADITGPEGEPDGEVGTLDLLRLLADWGPCPVGEICWSDIAGSAGKADCTVSTADLLKLLADWGECGQGGSSPPENVQDCIDKFGFEDPLVLGQCICAVDPEACEE